MGDICVFRYGKALKAENRSGSGSPVYGSNGLVGEHETALTRGATIIIGRKGSYGEVHYSDRPVWPIDTTYFVDDTCTRCDLRWLSYRLAGLRLTDLNGAAAVPGLNREDAYRQRLLLPPVDEQRRIARVLDAAGDLRAKRQKSLEVLEELVRSVYIDRFGNPAERANRLPLVPLSELGRWRSGGTPPRSQPEYFVGNVPWFSSGELGPRYVRTSRESLAVRAFAETSAKRVAAGSLLIGMYDTAALKTSIAGVDASCNQAVAFAELDETIAAPAFVHTTLVIGRDYFRRQRRGVRQKNLNLDLVRSIRIPLPDLSSQHEYLSMLAVSAACEERLRSHLARLDALFASLQHRAFGGDL